MSCLGVNCVFSIGLERLSQLPRLQFQPPEALRHIGLVSEGRGGT